MKKRLNITVALLLAAFAAGCNDAEYGTLGTHAYISESLSASSLKVMVDATNGADAQLTISLSHKADHDSEFKLVVDESVMEAYNKEQASSYQTLPAEIFEMTEVVTVKAGAFSSDPVSIHINPIPAELAGEAYAIPLRLENTDGSVPTTTRTGTFVIATEGIVISSLPMFNGGAGLSADGFGDAGVSLPQFTVECRFQVSNTAKRNRAVFTNGAPVLLRFEDPQNNTDEFKAHALVQFQGDGWYFNPTHQIIPNKWQHLALTYDGKTATLYVNGAFAGSKDGVIDPAFEYAGWFGGGSSPAHGTSNSAWSGCKTICSELRIWSVCRTEAQIQNNMTTTSAKSKDLVAYWRMNEGSGNVFEDYTGNGHTLRTQFSPTWISGIKSTDTETAWPE